MTLDVLNAPNAPLNGFKNAIKTLQAELDASKTNNNASSYASSNASSSGSFPSWFEDSVTERSGLINESRPLHRSYHS